MKRKPILFPLLLLSFALSSCGSRAPGSASSEGPTTSSETPSSASASSSASSGPSFASSKVSQETWIAQINNAGYVELFSSMTLRAVVTLDSGGETPYQEQIAEMDEGKLHLITRSQTGESEYYAKIDKDAGSYFITSYSRWSGDWSRYKDSTPHDFGYILKNWLLLTPYTVFRYADFSFDEEAGCYVTSTIYPGDAGGYSLGNVRCHFANNKATLLEMDMMATAEGGISLTKIGTITATIENEGKTRVELPIIDGEQPEVEKSLGEEILVTPGNSVNCRIALEANHFYVAYSSVESRNWTMDPSEAGALILEESSKFGYTVFQENEGDGHYTHFHLKSSRSYSYSFRIIDITGSTIEGFKEEGDQIEGRCLADASEGVRITKNGVILVSFAEHYTIQRHLHLDVYDAYVDGAIRLRGTCLDCGDTNIAVPFCYKALIGENEYELEETKTDYNEIVFTTTIDEVDSKQPIRFLLQQKDTGEIKREFSSECICVGLHGERCNATADHFEEEYAGLPITMQKAKNVSLELLFYNATPKFFLGGYTELPLAYLDTSNGNAIVPLTGAGIGGDYPTYKATGLSVKAGAPCRVGRWDEENQDFFEIPVGIHYTYPAVENNLVPGSPWCTFHNDADGVALTVFWDYGCIATGYREQTGPRVVRFHFHNTTHSEGDYCFYTWINGVDGEEYNWTGDWIIDGKTVGKYIDLDLRKEPFVSGDCDYIGFIIKKPGTWSGQSEDAFVRPEYYTVHSGEDGTSRIDVYICPGEGSSLIVSGSAEDVL